MRFLILINSALNYKYFFYEIAKMLKEQGHEVYYAIDSERSKFVDPLDEIDSSPNSFFFNTYFKEKYNKNLEVSISDDFLSDYLYSDFDRFLVQNFNLDKKQDKYWENAKVLLDSFFSDIMESKKIDCVLCEIIAHSFAYAAYKQCEKLGKKYIGLATSRIPNYIEIQNSIIEKELDKIESLRNTPASTEEIAWYEQYKKDIAYIQPDYMKSGGLDNVSVLRIFEKSKILRAFRFATIFYRYDYQFDYQTGNPLFIPYKGLSFLLKRYINSKLSRQYYLNENSLNELKNKENFYIYPMHYHPESSTSVLAPEYTNEYANIINIANNLPFGVYLYVKDHKSAKGIQSLEVYKKISRLPNVRFINCDVNIKELIPHSRGMITINSTAGYEALILDKPVYLFGRVFYENFSNVFKLNNFKELRVKILSESSSTNPMDFISYRRYCFVGKIDTVNFLEIDKVVDAILLNSKS